MQAVERQRIGQVGAESDGFEVLVAFDDRIDRLEAEIRREVEASGLFDPRIEVDIGRRADAPLLDDRVLLGELLAEESDGIGIFERMRLHPGWHESLTGVTEDDQLVSSDGYRPEEPAVGVGPNGLYENASTFTPGTPPGSTRKGVGKPGARISAKGGAPPSVSV